MAYLVCWTDKIKEMHSFKWKRKAKTFAVKPKVFSEEVDEEELDPFVDWLTATKRPKILHLEDAKTKGKRLYEEGVLLTEKERWWEAIGLWNSSLSLSPHNYTVHDMIAQAYMKVGELYPALSSASMAVKLAPNWWPGHQTLGRAQLGLGEVAMAVKSFSRAIHLKPDELELWKDDLEWAVSLLKKYKELIESYNYKRLQGKEEGSAGVILEESDTKFEQLENSSVNSNTEISNEIDERFNKIAARFDNSGELSAFSRGKFDPTKMICYRR